MIITVAILVNIIAIGTQVETDCHQLRKELLNCSNKQGEINCGPSSLPDFIKNYFLSFLSNSPFPPIPDGRMEQLMATSRKN